MTSKIATEIAATVLTTACAAACAAIPAAQVAPSTIKPAELQLEAKWDKVFAQSSKVNHSKITFVNRYGITLAADLYVPNMRNLSASQPDSREFLLKRELLQKIRAGC